MSVLLEFPKAHDDRVEAINRALIPAVRMRNILSIEWWIIHYYLMGARRFWISSWDRGIVRVGFQNDQGRLEFRYEEGLRELQTEVGRLMKMDLNPAVDGDGLSLDAMRKAAVAQAILNHKVAKVDLEKIKSKFIIPFVKYGTQGLGVWEWTRPDGTIELDPECIPVWQLLPLPADPESEEDRQAVVRQRTVPLAWLQTRPEFADIKSDDPRLNVRSLPIGVQPVNRGPGRMMPDGAYPTSLAYNTYQNAAKDSVYSNNKRVREGDPTTEPHVIMNEIFIEGPEGTCAEYIVKIGDLLPKKAQRNFWGDGIRKMMPLDVARYTPIDTFYGRGLCSRTIGINLETEKMLSALFENVQMMDEFGYLMCPSNLGINKRAFKVTDKPRMVFFNPDYSMPESRPFAIQPITAGEFPGRVATMATQIQQKLSGQSEQLGGGVPGRIESAAALGFNYEVSSIPLITPASEIKRTFSRAYARMLQLCQDGYEKGQAIHLATVDDTIAGVQFDTETMTLTLGENAIPDPWDVKITIKDAMPKPMEARKQEALMMLQSGILPQLEFIILNYKENWGFPVGNKAIWEAYQKAVLQVVVLFGDGRVPGRIFTDVDADNIRVFELVISTFMSKVQFGLATPDVKEAFYAWKATFDALKGQWPAQMPRLEDLGMMQGAGQGGSTVGAYVAPPVPAGT